MRTFIYIVLSIIGAIIAGYMIYFALHLYPSIIFRLAGPVYFVVISIIFGTYIGSISIMKSVAFPNYPITKTSKYSALFGLLALITLITAGLPLIFGILGIIFGIIGMINTDKKSQKSALYGFFASFVTLAILTTLAIIGYMHLTG